MAPTISRFQASKISNIKLHLSRIAFIRSSRSTDVCLPKIDDCNSFRSLGFRNINSQLSLSLEVRRFLPRIPLDLMVKIHFRLWVSVISNLNWNPKDFIWSSWFITTPPSRSDGLDLLQVSGFNIFVSLTPWILRSVKPWRNPGLKTV